MPWWVWIGGGVGIVAILVAIFWRSRNAKWVAELIWSFVAMAINALLPSLLKRMPPEDEEAWAKFKASNPTNEDIRAWKKAYWKRRKITKSSVG